MPIKQTLLVLLSVACTHSWAQLNTPAPSPSAQLVQMVGLTEVTVDYSRPSAKGRAIFGDLVPYDQLWRTGANQATTFTFDKPVSMNDVEVPAGSYAVLTKPGQDEWTLNLYPKKENGFPAYLERDPLVVVTAKPAELKPMVETFTIDLNALSNNSAQIVMMWANTVVAFDFKVGTQEAVMTQIETLENTIEASNANNYYSAASFLLSENTQLDKALEYVNKALELRPNAFWISRTKSLIQAQMGNYKDAVKTAEKSLSDASSANNGDFVRMNEASIATWKKK